MRVRVVWGLVLAIAAASCGPAASGFAAERALTHVAYLADPARAGRLSGSAQFMDAASYVADRFKDIGLEPLGDGGGWFERFQQPMVELQGMPQLARTSPAPKSYQPRTDFNEYVSGRAGGGDVEGPLTVAGHGETADFAGLDVRGRVVLVTEGPTGNPIENAYQKGALAVLIAAAHPEIRFSPIPFLDSPTIPALRISQAVAEELIGGPLAGARGNIDTRVRVAVALGPVHTVDTVNVVGLLRGSDAVASAQAVMVGGHLDHLGTDPNGAVFPGANDNASGVAITIEVARALAAQRTTLRRSVVFVAFGGEEEGYLGASAYVQRMAAVPGRPESLVAFLDVDAAGCCGDALGASAENASLQSRVDAEVQRLGIKVGTPTGGSDHQVFARARVPAVLVPWTDPILHTYADTIGVIDLRHMQGTGDVVTNVARDLAQSH